VSNGHSWSNIKRYTLSEIGVFVNSIYIKNNRDRIDKLSMDWMSFNLSQDGVKNTIKDMSKSLSKNKELMTKKEIAKDCAKDWRRLAALNQRG